MIIEFKHVRKEYPDGTPIRDLSATIEEGEIIGIIGPSGCGKSTLLRMINKLETPTSGQIFYRDTELTAPGFTIHSLRGKIAMVFQSYSLFGNLTVVENLCAAPVKLLGIAPQEAYENALEMLQGMGLRREYLKYPEELSGGQRQRVAMLMALSTKPDVLLMDEPTSALDPTMVGEVTAAIRRVHQMGITVIFVTHDMKFAENTATRLLYLDEGGVYEEGTPEEIFHHPQKPKTLAFMKRVSSFDCVVDSQEYDFMAEYTALDQFAYQNRIGDGMAARLKAIFEELCFQIILPKYEDACPHLRFHAEYSGERKEASVHVSFSGVTVDPESAEDALSWQLIRHYAEGPDVFYKDEKETIRLLLRERE